MMRRIVNPVARALLLQLPPEFEAKLAESIRPRRPGDSIRPMLSTLANLRHLCTAYSAVCVKYIIVSVAIVNSVLRALAKQDTNPDCTPLSWAAGVTSVFCGLASLTLSFSYANQFRLVSLNDRTLLIWIQNAQRNAASPWKNVFALLSAPSILCIWSIALYIIHMVAFNGGPCLASRNSITDYDMDVSLPNRLPWLSTVVGSGIMKGVVTLSAFLLWTYTVHAMRAFVQLSQPTTRYFGGQV